MTDNNNNNNNNSDSDSDNDDKNNINLNSRDISLNNFTLPPIDSSNNRIFRTWKINPILNRNLSYLETCRKKKYNLGKTNKKLLNKNQLNINEDNNNNMTINKVIDNIKERRKKNNKERFNKYRNFIKELDEKSDKEKTLMLEDKKKEEDSNNLQSILELLNKKVENIERTNSILFGSKDDSALFPIGRHKRRSSIYIPSARFESPEKTNRNKENKGKY